MNLPSFQLHLPTSIEHAVGLARSFDGKSAYLAGGTDLLVNAGENLNCKAHLISLSKIVELKELSKFSLGAGLSIAELVRKRDKLPEILGQAASMVAGPALRESATVGGNLLLNGRCIYFNQTELYRCSHGACMKAEGNACIAVPQKERCYAPFSGDLAAAFLVLNAEFVMAGPDGRRTVRACDFYLADGIHANVLAPGELLVKIKLAEDAYELKSSYKKLRPRSSVDFPEAGVAVAVKEQSGSISEIRVALTALGPAPSVKVLNYSDLKNMNVAQMAERFWKELSPSVLAVRNTSFPPTYRREMARLFIEQELGELLV